MRALGFVYAAQRQRSLLSPSFFHSLGSRSRTVLTDTTGRDRTSSLPFQTPVLSSLCPCTVFVVFISSPHRPLLCLSFFLRSLPSSPSNCTVPLLQSWWFIGQPSLFKSLAMVAREISKVYKNNLTTNQSTRRWWLANDKKTTNDIIKK